MKKAERKKIDAFEMWSWSRVMRVSWERDTNVWVMENIKPEWILESRVAQAALRHFGHVVSEERGMENDVMLVEMSGKRRRVRPRTKWLDSENTVKGPSIVLPRLSAGVGHDSTALEYLRRHTVKFSIKLTYHHTTWTTLLFKNMNFIRLHNVI